jgi:predicted ABC-type ATPase
MTTIDLNQLEAGLPHWLSKPPKPPRDRDAERRERADRMRTQARADREAKNALSLRERMERELLEKAGVTSGIKYDPDQPRDEIGRWTDAGGGGAVGTGDTSSSEPGTGIGTASGDSSPAHTTPAVGGKPSPKVREIEQKYKPKNTEGKDTLERHYVQDGKKLTPTAERKQLHDEIVNKIRGAVPASPEGERVYHMMGGGPASGKSAIIKAGQVELPPNNVHVDSDAIKADIPEYKALLAEKNDGASSYVHEESSDLAKRTISESYAAGQNVVLDGTGNASYEGVEKKVSQARAAGYKVFADYTTCRTEEAVRRNVERAKKTGRLPPESMLRNSHRSVSAILPKAAANGLFDKVNLWDTENHTDGKPTLVMSAEGRNMQIHRQDLWEQFLAKADE